MGRVAGDFGHSAIRRRSNMELWRDKGVLPSGPCPARSLWRRRIGTGAQRCRWPKDTQPIRAAAVGTYGGVASLVTAAKPRTAQRSLAAHGWGCSSLAPCHMSQLPFAQPIVVSGCALILNFTPLTL